MIDPIDLRTCRPDSASARILFVLGAHRDRMLPGTVAGFQRLADELAAPAVPLNAAENVPGMLAPAPHGFDVSHSGATTRGGNPQIVPSPAPAAGDEAMGIKPFFYAVADNEGRPVMDGICCCESPQELVEYFQDRIDDLTAKVVPVYTAPQIEKMRDEITALRAKLTEAEVEAARAKSLAGFADTRKECDQLRADLTALCDQLGACKRYAEMADGLSGDLPMSERVAQAKVMITDLEGFSDGMSATMDENDKLKTDIAAANERAGQALTRLRQIAVIDEEYHKLLAKAQERDAAKAEVAALRADLDGFHNLSAMRQCMIDVADDNKALKAEVAARNAAFARWKEETQKDVARIAELNAEVTALKERAVTIPLFVGGVGGHADGCDDMRRAAIKAIRAAGVKVVES